MYIVVSIYIVANLLAFLHIIMFGSRAAKSLSWVLVIIILPFLGLILYIIFGLNRRRFKFYTLKQTTKRRLYDLKVAEANVAQEKVDYNFKNDEKLANLMKRSSFFPAYSGNEITILQDGRETFDSIFDAVSKAEKFIHLQYYIFEEGKLMDKFYELFKSKIEEGVQVRILYDAIGSFSLSKKSVDRFKELGVQIFTTMSLSYGSFLFTLNYRNHRKIMVIDGIIGYTGGMNVSDKYIKKEDHLGIWDDTHAKIEGPAVDSLHRIFIKDYFFASGEESLMTPKYLPKQEKKGNSIAQIISSGPDSRHPSIMQQYIAMINLAEESIFISNPYFIPNNAMLESLRIAALGGIEIKILIPLKSDSWLAKHSMLSFFEELLELGVEIYAQRENFLHSKLIIIDGQIASIGSGNFDHRSFEHNFETNALIYDAQLAKDICADFLADCENSKKLDYEVYKKRSFKRKFSEGIARFFSPLL